MNIIELPEIKAKPDIIHEYSPEISNNHIPLIIDNGSYQCRVGWSTCDAPLLIFRNLIAKPRKDRKKDSAEAPKDPPIQIGNDLINIETMRFALKTQFDQNVVTHFTHQEHIYDYIFSHLNIVADNCVPHPILLTEAPCNPTYSRQYMTELLFECYGVPGICYGVDALFSFQRNFKGAVQDCMIISFGYHTTHVIPVLGGKMLIDKTRRLDVGGYHIITYLFRLMQMKYPVHSYVITVSRMEALIKQHGRIATDYMVDVENWAKSDYYDDHVKIIQLPYTQAQPNSSTLTEEQKFERRKELTKRLLEATARRNQQKLEEDVQQLQIMEDILELHHAGNVAACEVAMKEHGISNMKMLKKVMPELKARIERLTYRLQQPIDLQNYTLKEKTPVVPQPPDGMSIPDWVNETKEKRAQLYECKQARKTRRLNLAKRRTAASQERMRIISLLAQKEKGVDDFGMNDEDWDVYKAISRDNDSDSEVENEKLLEFEDILRHHDPTFKEPVLLSADAAENYQLHFGLEAIRTPELLFQPSMIGVQEMGLGELLEFVFSKFTDNEKKRLAGNIFLTGGCAKFEGIAERLDRELTELLPTKMPHKLSFAKMPELDAWLGARDFARASNFSEYLTTKEDYEEKGSDFFKEHTASNYYFPEAAAVATDDDSLK